MRGNGDECFRRKFVYLKVCPVREINSKSVRGVGERSRKGGEKYKTRIIWIERGNLAE